MKIDFYCSSVHAMIIKWQKYKHVIQEYKNETALRIMMPFTVFITVCGNDASKGWCGSKGGKK
jgi:hypothetical protein